MSSKEQLIVAAAQRLWDAEKERTPCEPIRDLIGEKDVELAYAIQQHNINRELALGRRISGRKIGITAKSVQRQLNVFEPDFGTLFADMEIGYSAVVPANRLGDRFGARIEGPGNVMAEFEK